MGVLEIGRRPAAGGEDHQSIPGVAEARTDGEQIGDLVFAEHVRLEALGNGQNAAGAPAFVEATAERRFHAHNPSAPLPLRARLEAEDGVAVVGGDVRRDRARRGEHVRDVVPGAAGIEAKVSPGPVVICHRLLKRGLDRHVRCHGRRRGHRRKRDTPDQELLHYVPRPVVEVRSYNLCGDSAVTSRQQIAGVFPSADAMPLQRR